MEIHSLERDNKIIAAMRLREEMLLQKKELYKSVPTLNDLCQKYEISQTRLYQIYRKFKARTIANGEGIPVGNLLTRRTPRL